MAKILVLDDEPSILLMIKKMLEKAGHEVEIALNGKEGMKLFEKNRPDLLITDIIMPEKEGLETIFELRKSCPELKIIAISGGGRIRALKGICRVQNCWEQIWFFKNLLSKKTSLKLFHSF